MKNVLVVCLTLALGTSGLALAQEAKPESLEQKASYGIGLNMGRQMKQQGVEIDADWLARGLRDALAGGKTMLTDEEIQTAMQELQQKLMGEQQKKMAEMAETNVKEGGEFLAANKEKEGVITLPSGLQYKVLTEGSGAIPTAEDTVSVHYTGKLTDGSVFDSSVERGTPATFGVTGVIKGWVEALQLMKVGSKWELFIPSDLAYGPTGKGPVIGPNAVLVFEVELLEIVAADS